MRVIRRGRRAVRRARAAILCAGALAGALVLTGHAAQSQDLAEGVYSAEQAARGREVYRDQCATCHGDALEGSVGPPLAGDGFLSVWSARPVVDLVDKIHNNMPLQAPAPLSRQESLDLVAYVLEAGGRLLASGSGRAGLQPGRGRSAGSWTHAAMILPHRQYSRCGTWGSARLSIA